MDRTGVLSSERDGDPVERRTFRPSSPKDAPAIVSVLAEAGLQPDPRPEALHWKYWQERADWPGSRSYVLESADRIVAHGAVVPGTLAWERERLRIVQVIDWAALPGAVGAGRAVMRSIVRLAGASLAVGGSADTLRILPHIGFRTIGAVTGYVRPLRPLGILEGRRTVSWRLLPRLARSALWALRAPRVDISAWSVPRIGPQETQRLAGVLPGAGSGAAVTERSEALFRYMLECPIVAAELYGLERQERMHGYFLLTFAPGQARLADAWLQSGDPATWHALIECAVRCARRHADVAELSAWGSDPLLERCLIECGFHPRNTRPVMLSVAGGTRIPSSLRVQMLDTDAAYLHHGIRELWA